MGVWWGEVNSGHSFDIYTFIHHAHVLSLYGAKLSSKLRMTTELVSTNERAGFITTDQSQAGKKTVRESLFTT